MPPASTPDDVPSPAAAPERSRLVSFVACAPACLVGVALTASWLLPGDALHEWASRTMKLNTALCAIALSTAVVLLDVDGKGRRRSVAHALAAGCLALAALTLLQYPAGIDLGIDQWLARDPRPVEFPNRMAPNSALMLCLASGSVLLAGRTSRTWALAAQVAGLAAFAIALLGAVGHVYDAVLLSKPTRFIAMSPWTAGISVPLTMSVLALQRDHGITRLLSSHGPGGYLARQLLVPVLFVPTFLGWLHLEGERLGIFTDSGANASFALASIVVFGLVVVVLARSVDRLEVRRLRAVEELRRAGELTAALARAATVQDVLSTTIEVGIPGLGARSGVFFLAEDDGNRLRVAADRGIAPGLLEHYADMPAARKVPATDALRTNAPVFLADRAAYLSAYPEVPPAHLQAHEAWAVLPLHGRNRTLGVLALSYAAPQNFGDAQRDRIAMLADHCAQALDRALLLDSEQHARARAEAAAREREEAHRAKDEFLAVLGHELRNPLSPILTSLHLMERRAPELLQKERSVIERQAQHMVRLVDDLLDVSRIARGKLHLSLQRVELGAAIAKAIELASPLLEKRSHRLHVEVPPHLELQADEYRLAQIFSNLLSNAARYSDPGSAIEIHAERVGDRVRATVRDEGSGIPPDLLPRLFEMFVQGERRLERAAGGLGLGLALVKNLTELHGGTVFVASAGSGRGSTFTVELPLAVTPSAPAEAPRVPAAAVAVARRILVVDDNTDAAELLAEALRLAGHSVEVEEDGPRALERAALFQPEMAFLDIGLPVMDGYELAGRLAELQHAAPPLLVAVTGYGQASDRERAAAAGFAHHLVKPVAIDRALAIAAGGTQADRQIA